MNIDTHTIVSDFALAGGRAQNVSTNNAETTLIVGGFRKKQSSMENRQLNSWKKSDINLCGAMQNRASTVEDIEK